QPLLVPALDTKPLDTGLLRQRSFLFDRKPGPGENAPRRTFRSAESLFEMRESMPPSFQIRPGSLRCNRGRLRRLDRAQRPNETHPGLLADFSAGSKRRLARDAPPRRLMGLER